NFSFPGFGSEEENSCWANDNMINFAERRAQVMHDAEFVGQLFKCISHLIIRFGISREIEGFLLQTFDFSTREDKEESEQQYQCQEGGHQSQNWTALH